MWNTGDTGPAAELVGEGFVDHSRVGITDAKSLAEVIRDSLEDDPSIHVYVDAVLGDGPVVNVLGRVRVTTSAGERIRNRIWTLRVDDRVREVWRY
jgi:hypothetical protein